MWCNLDNVQVLEPISRHKTRANKKVNLHSYLRFCGNIMCTAGQNKNLWLTEAIGIDTNGCDVPNGSNYFFLGAIMGVVGPQRGMMKN